MRDTEPTTEIVIDAAAGAAYIKFRAGDVHRTVELTDEVLVDLDAFDMAVGIEVLDLGADYPTAEQLRTVHMPGDLPPMLPQIWKTLRGIAVSTGTDGTVATPALREAATA